MTPDCIIRGTRREAEGLYQGREAGCPNALLRRRKAEAQCSPPCSEPTYVLADEDLVSGPAVLETEDGLEARGRPGVNSLNRRVKEQAADAAADLLHGHEVPTVTMLCVEKEAGGVALVPTGKELVRMLVTCLGQRRWDPLPVEGPTAVPWNGQSREGGRVLRGGTNGECCDPEAAPREMTPIRGIDVLQIAERWNAKSSEHRPKVDRLNGRNHFLYHMDQEVRSALLDDPRQEGHSPKVAGIRPQETNTPASIGNLGGLSTRTARAEEQQGAARDGVQEGVYQERLLREGVALEKKGPDVAGQERVAWAAARPTRGGPCPLRALSQVVVDFHEPRSDKVSAGDAEFVERRVDAEPTGGQPGEEVQESERTLWIGRRRREGRRRDGERGGGQVSPPHGPSWEWTAGAGGVYDDHRADGDPLEDRTVDFVDWQRQEARRRVQSHIRGA